MVTAIVVDDDSANLKTLSELLELNGLEILGTCVNGKEAVSMYEDKKPDFIFLDVMMPEFDGLFALEQIRKIDQTTKIIMVTADTTGETESILRKLNVTDVIHKPYDITSILHAIEDSQKSTNDSARLYKDTMQEINFELKLNADKLLKKWEKENKKVRF
ncbi:PleD family two-component system response regulator [Nitrosopumilus sp.]|uniref:response regulator n=1 Tax=Nitrosopumilus sp. TaxID=2024843 RepID=UPI002601745F|nr:response regulator [Nitrosopumilus sp.]